MKLLKKIVFLLIILGIVLGFYAFKIEPYRYMTETVSLNTSENTTTSLKVVQFSDTHIKGDFTAENLIPIVNAINAQDPDVIVFTGDLYDNYSTYSSDAELISVLSSLGADTKLAIWGNRDYGGGSQPVYEDIMTQSGFTVLRNMDYWIEYDGKQIQFTGLDDALMGRPLNNEGNENADYSILLAHEPDKAVQYATGYDLILAGHTHGGQIHIPLFNDQILALTPFGSTYLRGMYSVSDTCQMYVNPGIGTTHISARLGVVPEITSFIIHL